MVPCLWHHTTWFAFYLIFRLNFTFCLFDNSFIWAEKKKEHFEIWWLALNWKWIQTVFLINDFFRIFSTELELCILFYLALSFLRGYLKMIKLFWMIRFWFICYCSFTSYSHSILFCVSIYKPFFSLYFPSQRENIFFR
jgi:hypothetical protein